MLLIAILSFAAAQDAPGATIPGARTAQDAALDVCIYTPSASRDAACTDLLQAHAARVPQDRLAGDAPNLSASEPWVAQVCAADGLEPGQTLQACRREAQSVFRRARMAYRALDGQLDGRPTAIPSYRAELPAVAPDRSLTQAETEEATTDARGCRRSNSSWRDEDTGDSSASYSVHCSYGSDDPELRRQAREALDSLLGDDRP